MGITAKGTHAFAICDRCGFKLPYLSMRMEWTGHRVCSKCWEPKHPQLTPKVVQDAVVLRYPRPGENKREDVRIVLKSGFKVNGQVGLSSISITALGWSDGTWGSGEWSE